MIEIKFYSAIGDPTHFAPTRETTRRLHTPRDQAFFARDRVASAMRDSEIPVRESTTTAGSMSLIIDASLTSRQVDLLSRYFRPTDTTWDMLRSAGAIA